jgi:hypothetical protein
MHHKWPWGRGKWPLWLEEQRRHHQSDFGHKMAGVGGGCLFALLFTFVAGFFLSLAAEALTNPGMLLLGAWVIGGVLIYRLLRNRTVRREQRYQPGRRIYVEGAQAEPRAVRDQARAVAPPAAPARGMRTDEFVLALVAGFGLALACSLALTLTGAGATTGLVLPPLLGLIVGAVVYSLLRKRLALAEPEGPPTDREVRRQARRIRGKCRSLSREAVRAGGVFHDVEWQARELADHTARLARLLTTLRRAARDIQRGLAGNPSLPRGVSGRPDDEVLRRQLDAARAAQDRLEGLVQHNSRHQQLCLTQLERIEDLVDAARLEVSQPLEAAVADSTQRTIVDDLETELQAAREALAQVQQTEA